MAYSDEITVDSPHVYLRLGDSSGTTATDASGNGYDGTYVNTPTLGVTGALTDDADTAVTFDSGSKEHVTGTISLDISGGLTIECWCKTTDTSSVLMLDVTGAVSGGATIYANTTSGGGASSGRLRFYAFEQGGGGNRIFAYTTNTTGFNDGAWHHIVATVEQSTDTVQCFIDGSSVGITYEEQTTPSSLSNPATKVLVSGNDGGGTTLSATMDEFAVYAGVLSTARISAHYEAGVTSRHDAAIAWIHGTERDPIERFPRLALGAPDPDSLSWPPFMRRPDYGGGIVIHPVPYAQQPGNQHDATIAWIWGDLDNPQSTFPRLSAGLDHPMAHRWSGGVSRQFNVVFDAAGNVVGSAMQSRIFNSSIFNSRTIGAA